MRTRVFLSPLLQAQRKLSMRQEPYPERIIYFLYQSIPSHCFEDMKKFGVELDLVGLGFIKGIP
jgi:hypothetical protein